MDMPNSLKRAPVAGALFCCLATIGLWPGLAYPAGRDCHSSRYDDTGRVRYVHDGDTLWLADGRKVRIIGLNTPELARDTTPDEPLALAARDHLRHLLEKSADVRLRYGTEKRDRYGRLLAHVFIRDGTNISAALLKQGLGYSLTIPPNLWQASCYQRAEQLARRQKRGLWSPSHYHVLSADTLSREVRGFQIIRGRIKRIGHSRKAVWLDFNRRFAVRILRKDLAWFKAMDIDGLTGKRLEVRGWVQYYKHQLRMRVKHPTAIRILP